MTLLRQAIAESLLLSVAGGLIGIGLAALAIYGGRNLLPDTPPLTNEITLNGTVAGFALLLAVLTGVCCGLAPGFAALHTNVNAQMKESGRSGSESGAHARLLGGWRAGHQRRDVFASRPGDRCLRESLHSRLRQQSHPCGEPADDCHYHPRHHHPAR